MLAIHQTIGAITSEAHFSPHSINSLPVMLERLAAIDVVTLDAAVSSGLMGERAQRLLANRTRVAQQRLPKLLIMAHNDIERNQAQQAATQLQAYADSVTILDERGRNETAVNALAIHRECWPNISEQERKTRILLLSRRGGGGKPQFIAPFVGGAGTTCGAWTPVVAYQRGKTTWIAGTRSKEEEREATPIRGFLRGNYAQGVCPAECSFCYLRGATGYGHQEHLSEPGRRHSRTRCAAAWKCSQLGRTRGYLDICQPLARITSSVSEKRRDLFDGRNQNSMDLAAHSFS